MNLSENRIEMRIPRQGWFPRDLRFRIPKPFLIEFITASRKATSASAYRRDPSDTAVTQSETKAVWDTE